MAQTESESGKVIQASPVKSAVAEDSKKDDSVAVSPTKKDAEVYKKAMEYLMSGKRNLLVNDISGATTALEESCRLLGQHYGETAKECGESYFYYGKALLEMARLEAGVIDNAFDGVNEDSEDEAGANTSQVENPGDVPEEEKEKVSELVDDALIENCVETEKLVREKKEKETENKENVQPPKEAAEVVNGKGESHKDEAKKDDTESEEKSEEDEEEEEEEAEAEKEEKEGGDDDAAKETESIGSNEAGTSDNKDGNDKEAVEKEEEEDPSNLQLSWEMLELAKGIFSKHSESIEDAADAKRIDLENKLSETYQLLGEVSIENENYDQATEDLNSCLRRRQELLPADSRSIAETHYQLGVAMGFNLKFDEAVGSLEASIEVLESRIKNLKANTASVDPAKKGDAFYTAEKEIEEITKLIPEIQEKISDTRDMQTETLKKISESTGGAFDAPSSTSSDKPESNAKAASSIMIKKRKKSVESAGDAAEVSAAKKPNLETTSNGTSAETNGKSEEKMEAA